jgi:hypothetical protein
MHPQQPSRFIAELDGFLDAESFSEEDPEGQDERASDFFAQMQAMLQGRENPDEQP